MLVLNFTCEFCTMSLYLSLNVKFSIFSGTLLNTLYIYMWNIILLVHIVILNYLFVYYIPLFIIIGFDSTIILLLYVFDSERIVCHFYSGIFYLTQTQYFLFTEYPKIMCGLVVLLCIIVCLWYFYVSWILPIHAHCDRHHAKKHRKTLADSIVDLQKKVDSIEERLKKLDDFLRKKTE